jgi:hypothetical protein
VAASSAPGALLFEGGENVAPASRKATVACGGRGQPWREPRFLVHHARRLFNGLAFARRLASSDEREQTGGHAAEGGGSDAASRRGVLPCRGTAGQKRPLPAERRSGPALRILHICLTDGCTHDQRFRCWTREAARKNRSQMSSRVRNSAMFGERVDFSELPKWPCVRRTSVFRERWRTIASSRAFTFLRRRASCTGGCPRAAYLEDTGTDAPSERSGTGGA